MNDAVPCLVGVGSEIEDDFFTNSIRRVCVEDGLDIITSRSRVVDVALFVDMANPVVICQVLLMRKAYGFMVRLCLCRTPNTTS